MDSGPLIGWRLICEGSQKIVNGCKAIDIKVSFGEWSWEVEGIAKVLALGMLMSFFLSSLT